jgi:hypothetical protein
MHKKPLQMMATTFQEVDERTGVESIFLCNTCKTLCNADEFNKENNNCIFCNKKINQFGSLQVFTFKPVIHFFQKIGASKNDIEIIEYDQMIHGLKTDFLEYNSNNMVWYVYDNVEGNVLYCKVAEIFDYYKNINFNNKSCIKNSLEKFRHMFLKNMRYVAIHMIVSDVISSELNFSVFLPRERFFI